MSHKNGCVRKSSQINKQTSGQNESDDVLGEASEIERKPTKGRNWSDSTQMMSEDVRKNPFVETESCGSRASVVLRLSPRPEPHCLIVGLRHDPLAVRRDGDWPDRV